MARQKMTSRKKMTPAQKYERLDRHYSDFTAGSISIHSAWVGFIAEQITKGNSKATIDFYNRFYKKLKAYVEQLGQPDTECPVEFLESDREHFEAVVREWRADKITAVEAMKRLDVKPNTFYRRVKEWGL